MPKILCVDDDSFYENLYRDILTAHGFEVKHAFNAADGWELAQSYQPELVTLDVMMPEKAGLLDGYGFLKAIRAHEQLNAVPVIMISALGEESDSKRAIELGATMYLPKQTLTPRLLVSTIEKLLKKK